MGSDAAVMIPISGGHYAIVDAEDAPRLRNFPWHIKSGKKGVLYARTGRSSDAVYMHQLILKYGRGMVADHINRDGLDNRKQNLRLATYSQNNSNRVPELSGIYKGIHRHPDGRWRAQIRLNRKTRHLGLFDSPEDAAKAYDIAATELFGEFARLNFPKGGAGQ